LTPRNEAARVRILLLALTIAITSLGCSRAGAPAVGSNANTNAGAKPSAPPATSSSDPGAPMRITFSTDDDAGVQIAGDLYVPDKTPAAAVLALHQWGADRGTYKDFAKTMRDAGFVVLTIDGRGFGESTVGADGKVEPGWNLQDDIAAAVDYLKEQPAVDAQRIGIVGASYGASNALIYAAGDPQNIRAVALLSVGLNYHDSLPTEPAIKKYGDRPLLMVAAKDDAESADATTKLAGEAKSPKYMTKIYDTGGHGTALLAPAVGGTDLLKTFFVKNLTGPIAAPAGTKPGAGEEPGSGPGENAPPAEKGKGAKP
jgi:dienelactone hydrolase